MSSSRRSGRTGCQPVQTPNALAARSTSGRACRRRPRASARVVRRRSHAHPPLVVQRRHRQRQPCHQPLRFGRRPPRHPLRQRQQGGVHGRQGPLLRLRQRRLFLQPRHGHPRHRLGHHRDLGNLGRILLMGASLRLRFRPEQLPLYVLEPRKERGFRLRPRGTEERWFDDCLRQ